MAMHLPKASTVIAANMTQETFSESDVSEVSDGPGVSEVSSEDSNPTQASSEVCAPVQAVHAVQAVQGPSEPPGPSHVATGGVANGRV